MIYNELELSKTLRLSDFRYRIKAFIKIVIAMASTTKCAQSALIAQFASANFRVANSSFIRSMSVEFSERVAKMSYPA